MLLPLLLRKQLCHELVIGVPQLLVHTVHDSDIFVLNEVDLFEIDFLRQGPRVISEEEVTDCLSLEG